MNNKLRKDDLDVLGEMGNFVGSYMNDFVSKTNQDSRGKLFKNNVNIRETLAKAILPPTEDIAQVIVPDNSNLSNVPIPLSSPPPIPAENRNIPPQAENKHTPQRTLPNSPVPILLNNKLDEQLNFNFLEQTIPNYGSVEEVIKHFDDRLDNLEISIKLIKAFMIELRSNMFKPKKRKNEFKETTRTNTMA